MNAHVSITPTQASLIAAPASDMRTFAKARAAEYGTTLEALCVRNLTRKMSRIRHAVMFELAVAFPNAGCSAIGRIMKRDHSATCKAIKMEAERRGVPVPLSRWVLSYDIEAIRRDYDAGLSYAEIARRHDRDQSTIWRLIDKYGIKRRTGA